MPCEKNFLTSDVPGAFGNYKFSIQFGCSVLSLNFLPPWSLVKVIMLKAT